MTDSRELQQKSRRSPDKTSECMCMYVCERYQYIHHTAPIHQLISCIGNNYEDNPHNNVVKVLRLEFPVLFSATIQKWVVLTHYCCITRQQIFIFSHSMHLLLFQYITDCQSRVIMLASCTYINLYTCPQNYKLGASLSSH